MMTVTAAEADVSEEGSHARVYVVNYGQYAEGGSTDSVHATRDAAIRRAETLIEEAVPSDDIQPPDANGYLVWWKGLSWVTIEDFEVTP